MYLDIIFKVIGGLGIFLYGMDCMSSGMQKLAGKKLKKVLAVLTTNRVIAIIMGVVVTMLVQSSSVSTVMTIGFINASLLTLKQGLGVIFGANIGTTVTGWILVLNIGKYGLPIVGVAVLAHMFLKNDRAKTRALTIMGLGMIFLGLQIMSNGLKPVRSMPEFVRMFHMFSADTYFGIIKVATVGALITAIVQSSSATLGITITLAVQGLINYDTAVALVLGENVGTTITAILATLNANVNAKRAAYAHTLLNILGVVWVTAIFPYYIKFLKIFALPEHNITMAIATAHTLFNVVNVVIFSPFIGVLADFLCKIVKDNGKSNDRVTKIDPLMLNTSSIAVEQIRTEIGMMAQMIQSIFAILDRKYSSNEILTDTIVKECKDVETLLDKYQREITDANFVLLTNKDINNSLRRDIRNSLITSDEFETVSDYLMRIINDVKELQDNGITLTQHEKENIINLHKQVTGFFTLVQNGFKQKNFLLVKEGKINANNIVLKYRNIKSDYLEFGVNEKGVESKFSSTKFMEIIRFYRRISDHLANIVDGYTGKI